MTKSYDLNPIKCASTLKSEITFKGPPDATNVELSDDDFVKTTKSNKVDADDVNVKFVELPIESVIIAGARNVKRQLISFASTLVVVTVPFSITDPCPSS